MALRLDAYDFKPSHEYFINETTTQLTETGWCGIVATVSIATVEGLQGYAHMERSFKARLALFERFLISLTVSEAKHGEQTTSSRVSRKSGRALAEIVPVPPRVVGDDVFKVGCQETEANENSIKEGGR